MKAMTRLEHANITVPDIDAAIRFLSLAAPDFTIRKDGIAEQGYRWVHIGNDKGYLALQDVHVGYESSPMRETYVNCGVNHLGMIIEDAEGVGARLDAAGYRRNGPTIHDTHRIRLYFYDDAGLEWELVEYSSSDPEKRYLYE